MKQTVCVCVSVRLHTTASVHSLCAETHMHVSIYICTRMCVCVCVCVRACVRARARAICKLNKLNSRFIILLVTVPKFYICGQQVQFGAVLISTKQ